MVVRVLNRRTSGSHREYVHHPNLTLSSSKQSATLTAKLRRPKCVNNREKFCHGILCDLFIGLSWYYILHLIVLPGRMRHKRIKRLKEDTPDSILSLLHETRKYRLTYSSVSLFQPRRRKTPHTPRGRAPAIHNALPIAREADRSDAAITQPLPDKLLPPAVLKRTRTRYTQNHRLTTKQQNL